MKRLHGTVLALLAWSLGASAGAQNAQSPQLTLIQRAPDPHGTPRPAGGARDVPCRTSFYFELALGPDTEAGRVLPETVTVSLQPNEGAVVDLLSLNRKFAAGVSGWLRPRQVQQGIDRTLKTLAVYLEPGQALLPATNYTVHVAAKSQHGLELNAAAGSWTFTTEASAAMHPVKLSLDLHSKPVRWRGAFFSGFCNVVSCTQDRTYSSTYALMDKARKHHPRAWMCERGIYLTGTQDRNEPWMLFLNPRMPNIVRERETRRVALIENHGGGVLLHVEDFFGHQQYGIPTGRPLSQDYHPGDEVLLADGVHDARAKVLAADDNARTVQLDKLDTPPGGWLLDYQEPAPLKEDPDAPGLFRAGGCLLRKLKPHGTAYYYWGRIDKELDLIVRRHNRRLVANFCEAPNDISIDGRSFTTAKDYVQWHEVAQTIAGHIIDRYGEKSLEFTWSIFNEPELRPLFWRSDWNELQNFYDYTTDAILRAFEDRGYDSNRVFIGGLELAGIFGTNLNLTEFLAHCSPTATAKGALPLNAAFADKRLDGKRSRRVEALCKAHHGKGSPCNFVSVHSYNRSEITAGKLIRAKETALQIDPEFYKDLWVNSHESCPDWAPPPDVAAADSYLGNGYFPSWCADVMGRQLRKAAADERFAFGETILTIWPPPSNFTGINTFTRIVHVDDNGDGKPDRSVTIPSPIFHALNLISDLGPQYWALPHQQIGGHLVSGFASRDEEGVVRLVLYSHHPLDTQSRSGASFEVALDVAGLGWEGAAQMSQFRFDREHNSYFAEACALRDRPVTTGEPEARRIESALKDLIEGDADLQRKALATLNELSSTIARDRSTVGALIDAGGRLTDSKEAALREAAQDLGRKIEVEMNLGTGYPRQEVEQIQTLAECRPTAAATHPRQLDGTLNVTVPLAANGLNILVIQRSNP